MNREAHAASAHHWSAGTIGVGVLLLVLTGCRVGPDYRRPAPLPAQPVPSSFSDPATTNAAVWKPAQPGAHLPRSNWWTVFGDPELDRLESLAAAQNQELAAAAARFAQARASVNVARSDYFPHISAQPSYARQSTSANAPQSGRPAGSVYTFNNFLIPLEAGWELDLWGRVRRQVEAARARLAASADDTEAVRLAIHAELAADYFSLRAFEAELRLLERTVETYRRSLELTRNRRVGGLGTDLDVAQAESQLRAAEAQLPATERQRERLLHALAALCGQPAGGFQVSAAPDESTRLPAVPVSLPSELLERRPDIAAAERRVAAANAQVGVAQTAFYPRVKINGLAGLQSIDASTLFNWPSRFWAVGPSLDLPLFTGGRNLAELAAARANYDESVSSYRQSVLAAFQEVEDQLAGQRLVAAQLDAEVAGLTAAQRALEIATNRYRAGLVTYLEVAIAQSVALERERTVVQLRAERLTLSVALIRSMGGGWEAGGS